jgi:hypothetical protein
VRATLFARSFRNQLGGTFNRQTPGVSPPDSSKFECPCERTQVKLLALRAHRIPASLHGLNMADSRGLQSLLDDLARLVDQEESLDAFATKAAQILTAQFDLVWVGLWTAESPDGSWTLVAAAGLPGLTESAARVDPQRRPMLDDASLNQRLRQFRWIADEATTLQVGQGLNPKGAVLSLVVPVSVREGAPLGWEFVGGSARFANQLETLRPALEAVASLTAERVRSDQIASLKRNERNLWRWLQVVTTAIRQTDGQQALNLLAEETRLLLGCDRAWIVEVWGESVAALAVSSAPLVERRGELACRLEGVVHSAMTARRRGGVAAAGTDLRSLVDPAVCQPYFDLARVRDLCLIPLPREPDEPLGELIGIVVCENFDRPCLLPRVGPALVQRCGGSVMQQILRSHRPFWRRLSNLEKSAWRRVFQNWRARLCATAALLLLCPIPFRITAEGELQPVDQLRLFAPEDSVVTDVLVEHGVQVEAGQLLLRLRSSRLELDQQRIDGELLAARERLAGLETSRLGGQSSEDRGLRGGSTALAGEEAGLREQVASLVRQSQSLATQAAALEIRPSVPGRILTWDPAPRLQARPVQRGQLLLELGSGAEGWRLDLWVSGSQARHLPESLHPSDHSRTCSFRRRSVPGFRGMARLHTVANVSDIDSHGETRVRLEARIEGDGSETFRPGESVTAEIFCGLRPIVYTLFPDLLDSCRRWISW